MNPPGSAQLKEHLPIEQGLRHIYVGGVAVESPLKEHLPIEQGLRLCI